MLMVGARRDRAGRATKCAPGTSEDKHANFVVISYLSEASTKFLEHQPIDGIKTSRAVHSDHRHQPVSLNLDRLESLRQAVTFVWAEFASDPVNRQSLRLTKVTSREMTHLPEPAATESGWRQTRAK